MSWFIIPFFENTFLGGYAKMIFGLRWHERKKNLFVWSKFISWMNTKMIPSPTHTKKFEYNIFPSLYISQMMTFPTKVPFQHKPFWRFLHISHCLLNVCWHLLMRLFISSYTNIFFCLWHVTFSKKKVKVDVKIDISQFLFFFLKNIKSI